MKELKPNKMWCVVDSKGYFHYDTFSSLKKDCIYYFLKGFAPPYAYWRKQGYKAVKVLVTIQKVK